MRNRRKLQFQNPNSRLRTNLKEKDKEKATEITFRGGSVGKLRRIHSIFPMA